MNDQWVARGNRSVPQPALVALACTSCKTPLFIPAPMEKFTRFRKISCHRCGQPHRMDLYFIGERDCFDLVPVTAKVSAIDLEDDD